MHTNDIAQSYLLPRLAIVGRPNVGKSTLFNRLIGQRKAIIDPTPGVTRDPLSHTLFLGEIPCILVDTGGMGALNGELDLLIVQKSLSVVCEADIIILLLDVTILTPEDEELIERLRCFSPRILLAVNKVDHNQHLNAFYEYNSIGFGQAFPISAAHGNGIAELMEELETRLETVVLSMERTENRSKVVGDMPHPIREGLDLETKPYTIAILGQPNTGKSTLSNFLSKGEQSIVSPLAGTTRDVLEREIEYRDEHFYLLDTAGIRRKKKVNENVEYYSVNRAISAIKQSELIFLMIDALKGLSDQDKKIASQAVKHGRGIILVLNKWDLMAVTKNHLQASIDRIRFVFPVLSYVPILPLSAKEGTGIDSLLETAYRLRIQLHRTVSTGVLNRKLAEWKEKTPPPSQKGFRWKVRYIVQAGNLPMKFILFVNRKNGFPESYASFIKNCIRQEFQLPEIPIFIDIRDSRQKKQ